MIERTYNSKMQRWMKILWVPLLWIMICIIFYWDVLNAPVSHIVGGNDLTNMFRIWLDYARARIAQGKLPLWNPYLFSGYSFYSDPQVALFYPITWLSFILPATKALSLSLVFHIWWSAVGCSLWLRSIQDSQSRTLSWASCIAGAAVFAFSGYTFARIQAGHIGVIMTGAWLPWTLLALNVLVKSFSWKTVVNGAMTIAFAFLAGHTATFILFGYTLIAYVIIQTMWLSPDRRKHYLMKSALMAVFGLLLASIQLLPLMQILQTSTRLLTSDYNFASRFSWPVGYIITLFVPNFFGEPVRTGYWGDGNYDEMIFYVGVLPLLMVWVCSRIKNDKEIIKQSVFWLFMAVISILIAFGSNSILHRLFFRFLPFFSSMRAPARAGFLLTCCASVLTALGIHALTHSDSDMRQFLLLPLKKIYYPVLFVSILLVIAAFSLYAWGKDSQAEAGRFWHMANAMATFTVFFTLASIWIKNWHRPQPQKGLAVAGIAIILLDLWTLGATLTQVVPAPLNDYWERVAQYTDGEPGRILPWGLSIFEQNGALSYQISSVFGYNPLEDSIYNSFITSNPDPRAKIYDLLNVSFVTTGVPLMLQEDDSLILKAEENGFYVYERSTALPYAWMPRTIQQTYDDNVLQLINCPTFDPMDTAITQPGVTCPQGNGGHVTSLQRAQPEIINANVESDGGILIFSERYTPGWLASIDGEKTEILKVYGLLQAVCVPPGEHQVQLIYRPSILIGGLILSIATLLICMLLYGLK